MLFAFLAFEHPEEMLCDIRVWKNGLPQNRARDKTTSVLLGSQRHMAGIRSEGPGDAAPQLAALWRGLGLCLWGQADQERHGPQYDHSGKKTCLLLKQSETNAVVASSLETQAVSLDAYSAEVPDPAALQADPISGDDFCGVWRLESLPGQEHVQKAESRLMAPWVDASCCGGCR